MSTQRPYSPLKDPIDRNSTWSKELQKLRAELQAEMQELREQLAGKAVSAGLAKGAGSKASESKMFSTQDGSI